MVSWGVLLALTGVRWDPPRSSLHLAPTARLFAGVSRPGQIVWSRVFIGDGVLHLHLGRGDVADLPPEETRRRLAATDPQWPIMHAVLDGLSRDQLMGWHQANHVQVVYAPDADTADRGLLTKAAFFAELGVHVHLCGDVDI